MCKEIGDRIKAKRKEKNLTQKNIEDATYISTCDLSNYENGRKHIGYERAKVLAKFLGTTTEYILEGGDDKADIFNSNSYGESAVKAFIILFETNVLRMDRETGVLYIPPHLEMCYEEMQLLLSFLYNPKKLEIETEREKISLSFEQLEKKYDQYLEGKNKEIKITKPDDTK